MNDSYNFSKSVFANREIKFDDGSTWKIRGALSSLAYQQSNAPFEARQVFSCACLDDPQGKYSGIEAVMKVKYQ